MKSQPIDLNTVSLDQFCKVSNSRLKHSAPGKSRDVIDALRTVAWYQAIKHATNLTNDHALEKELEPESFRLNEDNEIIRRNKWGKYRLGQHTPSDEFIEKISARTDAKTGALFHHPIWSILRSKEAITNNWSDWMLKISPEIKALFNNNEGLVTLQDSINKISRQASCKRLARKPGLDGLAFITLMLRYLIETKQHEMANTLSLVVCRFFLIHGHIYKRYQILGPLIDFYEITYFKNAASKAGGYFSYRNQNLTELIGYLEESLYHIKDLNPDRISLSKRAEYRYRIICGHFGIDLLYFFEPFEIPAINDLPKDHPATLHYVAQIKTKEWIRERGLHKNIKAPFPVF